MITDKRDHKCKVLVTIKAYTDTLNIKISIHCGRQEEEYEEVHCQVLNVVKIK